MTKKNKQTTDYLQLAHEGTAQSVKTLEQMISVEKDEERRAQLELALGESRFFYMEPKNATEEKDWQLGRMVFERDRRLEDLTFKIESKKLSIEKLKVERSVHVQLLKKNPKNKEKWQYNFVDDFLGMEQNKLSEMEEEEQYESAWIETAKQMIKTKKYLEAPAMYWEHVHDGSDCCDDDCCDSEKDESDEDCGCSPCA